jgi:hypothetical protein
MGSKLAYVKTTLRPIKKVFIIEKGDTENFKKIIENCSGEIGGLFNLILISDWFRDSNLCNELRKFIVSHDPDIIVNFSSIENDLLQHKFKIKTISDKATLKYLTTPLHMFNHSPIHNFAQTGQIKFVDASNPKMNQFKVINYGIANIKDLKKELSSTIFGKKRFVSINEIDSKEFLNDLLQNFRFSLLKLSIKESQSSEAIVNSRIKDLLETTPIIILGIDDDVESQAYFWSLRATRPDAKVVWLNKDDLLMFLEKDPQIFAGNYKIMASEKNLKEIENNETLKGRELIRNWVFDHFGKLNSWQSFSQTSTLPIIENQMHIEHQRHFSFSNQGINVHCAMDIANVEFFTLPKGESIGELCYDLPDKVPFKQYFSRVSSNGLSVYFDQFEPTSQDSLFLELKIPSTKLIFEKYFDSLGFDLKPTASENTFNRLIELVGGPSEIKSIRSEFTYELLLKMTPLRSKKIAKEIAKELKNERITDQVEEIITKILKSPVISSPIIKTVEQIESSLNLKDHEKEIFPKILESLVHKKFIQRGKYFECPNCQNDLWYQLDQIEKEIKCYSCSTNINLPVFVESRELKDSYKLNEMVANAVDQGIVPILFFLGYFHDLDIQIYNYLANVEIYEKGSNALKIEIDFVLNCLGRIGLFELKAKRGFDKNQIDKLINFSKLIEADFIGLVSFLPGNDPRVLEAKEWLRDCGVENVIISFEDIFNESSFKNNPLTPLFWRMIN